jgi:hypothetical protein
MDSAVQHSPSGLADEKLILSHKDVAREETAHEAAEQGVAATDK